MSKKCGTDSNHGYLTSLEASMQALLVGRFVKVFIAICLMTTPAPIGLCDSNGLLFAILHFVRARVSSMIEVRRKEH
jgi:hypothetical protein